MVLLQKFTGLHAHEDSRGSREEVHSWPIQPTVYEHPADDPVLHGQQAADQGCRTHVAPLPSESQGVVIA